MTYTNIQNKQANKHTYTNWWLNNWLGFHHFFSNIDSIPTANKLTLSEIKVSEGNLLKYSHSRMTVCRDKFYREVFPKKESVKINDRYYYGPWCQHSNKNRVRYEIWFVFHCTFHFWSSSYAYLFISFGGFASVSSLKGNCLPEPKGFNKALTRPAKEDILCTAFC